MTNNTTYSENIKARCRNDFLKKYTFNIEDKKSLRKQGQEQNETESNMKFTDRTSLVVRIDMNEIFECIECVFDSHIRDIELLESVVYDMRHSKLTSEMFYEPMKIGLSRVNTFRKEEFSPVRYLQMNDPISFFLPIQFPFPIPDRVLYPKDMVVYRGKENSFFSGKIEKVSLP